MIPSKPDPALVDAMRRALSADDAVAMQALLTSRPEGRAAVNEPIAAFDAPPIVHARSRAMLDVLLDAGADINARSRWWAGSFGLLDSASADLATYAVGRGALLTVHAAARLGWMTELGKLVETEPELIRARGGDGQTPLHFAGTIEAAVYLIERGADIDALDIDHESTPAQYMTGDREEIARELLRRGCRIDLMLAAAVGDARQVERLLDETPDAIRMRVDGEWFPKRNPHAGGTIYQWTLGFHASPHQVARTRDHRAVIDLLTARSPADVALTEACWAGDELAVREIVARHPSASRSLGPSAQPLLAHAARNNQTVTVRLMVGTGWLVDARGQHGATALHWASYHGNVQMVEALLGAGAPIDLRDRDFNGTPIGWAIHGSEQSGYAVSGDYRGTVERLLRDGARPDQVSGSADVREVLRSFTA